MYSRHSVHTRKRKTCVLVVLLQLEHACAVSE